MIKFRGSARFTAFAESYRQLGDYKKAEADCEKAAEITSIDFDHFAYKWGSNQ